MPWRQSRQVQACCSRGFRRTLTIEQFQATGSLPANVSPSQIKKAAGALKRRPPWDLARQIAIETGEATLDSEGRYQPPLTIEREQFVSITVDLLNLIIGFTESNLLKYSPQDPFERFADIQWLDQSDHRNMSLQGFIAWLTDFENERKKRFDP